MSWLRRLTASIRSRKLEHDLDRELSFHLEMRVREKIAAGANPEEARCDVIRRFGSVDRTKEACREHATFGWISALRQDLRYAARNLRKNPGFTIAATACLAIGIGANTVVFSFVNAFLFQPFPAGVVRVGPASGAPISYAEFQDWQRLNRVFDRVFANSMGESFTIGRGPHSQAVLGETILGDYFPALGVVPAMGRLLTAADESQAVAVVSHHFWRTRFHADPEVIGTTMWIDRRPYTIVGVASAGFHGMMAPWTTEVWTALQRDRLADPRAGWLQFGARLKSGITPRQAATAMNALNAELERQHPNLQRNSPDRLMVQRPGLGSSPVWSVFLVMSALLMAVVGIIYLIACANVAGLLIARAAARRREIVVRLSLGVSRARLVRQLLTESLLLGLLGAIAGVAVSFSAGDALAKLFPKSISHGFEFQHAIDLHVLAWTLALAVASVLIAGLLPALGAADQNLAAAGRTFTALGGRSPRLRQGLTVAQVAASVLVLATAGVFIRSFQKSLAIDPGFDAAHLVTVDLNISDLHYSPAQTVEFYQRVQDAVRVLPGVASVSLADVLPLGNQRVMYLPEVGDVATATVDADYFRTMGIPLLRGRQPTTEDGAAVVVNRELADRLFPNQDPIGKFEKGRVIAVASTSKYWSLTGGPRPFLYRIAKEFDQHSVGLALRAERPSARLAEQVRQAIERLNPDFSPAKVETGQERLLLWLEPQRTAALILGTLGFAALALAITGLYALLAQLLVQRTPEIAVRVALGATRKKVLALLLRQSAILVVAGTAAGVAASLIVARLLGSGIGAIGTLDIPTLVTIVALLTTVSTTATALPAYRALRIDPAAALRHE